ncbi:MAG TPA: xanthine dehydrogenase family protein subunit M [Candidatus Limnocylindria bacterium]
MRSFDYRRPTSLQEAVALLAEHGPAAQVLAGGTDLVIGLRDRTVDPDVVVDLKWIPDLWPGIAERDGWLAISAGTTMSQISADPAVRRHFPALIEAADVVGSVQIRNRATLAGNICNASPAADTAPPLLVFGARVVAVGPDGRRTIPIDEFFVRSRVTTLQRGELVAAVELPVPGEPIGAAYLRLTRRRGTDLASITMCAAVERSGVARLAYGSVGPRPLLFTDESGVLADPSASDGAREAILERMLEPARPSPRSVRASPEYRLAMLRVLARRALAAAIQRLGGGA